MLRLAAVLMTCSTVLGQQPTALQALQADPRFRTTAEKTFLQYEDSLSTHCTQITPDWNRAQQTIYVAPVSDAQNRLTSGVWSQMVPGVACGQPRSFRALVVIRDGRIGLSRQLPGTSNTTALLEHDVRLWLITAFREHHPHEEFQPSFDVLDTSLVGPNPPPAHQTWTEIWLIRVNGQVMRVSINFIPDQPGGGTNFHLNSIAAADLPPSPSE